MFDGRCRIVDLLPRLKSRESHHGISARRGLRGFSPHFRGNQQHTGGDPLGLTTSVGLWPGQTSPISSRVTGMRVFSGMTLSTGVAGLNMQYRRLNALETDTRLSSDGGYSVGPVACPAPEDAGMC